MSLLSYSIFLLKGVINTEHHNINQTATPLAAYIRDENAILTNKTECSSS